MKKWLLTAVISVFLAAAMSLILVPKASASVTVCGYLDANPTIAGVEDLVGLAIVANGMTPEEAGKFIVNQVITWCPRHLLTLQAYVNKWDSRKTRA